MFWNACMCAQRSAVLMQGSSLLGVSFTRPLHALDEGSAGAPDGAIRPKCLVSTPTPGGPSI
jgi:hypothetical protein